MSKEEVENLLRHGAYDIFREEKDGVSEKESNEFIEQDIDTILERRSKTVIHDNTGSRSNAAGGTFSKASFNTTKKDTDGSTTTANVDVDDPDFWEKMVGKSSFDNDIEKLNTGKRSRKKAEYSEKYFDEDLNRVTVLSDDEVYSSDSDAVFSDEEYDDKEFNFSSQTKLKNDTLRQMMEKKKELFKSRRQKKRWGGKGLGDWKKTDVEELLNLFHRFGYGNVEWKRFIDHFLKGSSKEYEHKEVSDTSTGSKLNLVKICDSN